MTTARIGLSGLGTMGSALALNIAEKGIAVAVTNRSPDRLPEFLAQAGPLADRIRTAETPKALVASLDRPRIILLMVPAGRATDEQIVAFAPWLEEGDILVDGGNADFHDTRKREKLMLAKGLYYVGLGISGGEDGARHGPSLMAGGSAKAWEHLGPILETIAARHDGRPCAGRLGPDGAGHFVKTVHNGIEYADMQLIAEVHGFLQADGRPDAAALFATWNSGPLNSYLTEITAQILRTRDPATARPIVDVIADRAGQKGTGRWTAIEAQKLGIPATLTEAAIAARAWSALAAARQQGAGTFGPADPLLGPVPTDGDLEQALLAGRILALTQGMQLLSAASDAYDWTLDLAAVAEVWRAGCIIRSALLDDVAAAVRDGLPHGLLSLAPRFAAHLAPAAPALRRTVAAAAARGLPVPALSAALAYFESLRSARLGTALIQAQRDFFGAHGFGRVDADGTHHGPWR